MLSNILRFKVEIIKIKKNKQTGESNRIETHWNKALVFEFIANLS